MYEGREPCRKANRSAHLFFLTKETHTGRELGKDFRRIKNHEETMYILQDLLSQMGFRTGSCACLNISKSILLITKHDKGNTRKRK